MYKVFVKYFSSSGAQKVRGAPKKTFSRVGINCWMLDGVLVEKGLLGIAMVSVSKCPVNL